MSRTRTIVVSAAVGLSASIAGAAITPRWVENPIAPAAIVEEPLLANARSFSLVVDLSGASLFNVAGLRLDQTDLPGVTLYNHPFGVDTPPAAPFIPVFPALAYDTYVATTLGSLQAPSVPGKYEGPGAAVVGQNGEINVSWGATPASGPLGGTGLEIARITLLGIPPGFPIFVPNIRGEVRASDAPNVAVPLPPLIPEPGSLALAAAGVAGATLRRRWLA